MSLRTHLEKIQNSSESAKKIWLIALSSISAVLIIAFWLVYLNYFFDRTVSKKTEKTEIGFWQIFSAGIKITSSSIKDNSQEIISKIIGQRTIIIEN
ncbi:MAG: hypothetical protein AAB596_00515 [Patescibacteria group bacterium]